MSKFLKSDTGIILLIIALFFAVLPFFFLHQGLLLIDTGREFYIPEQMLNGAVLYKDILNIYGPLAYQINALLFMIFGIKINTLYFAGIINSLIIILSVYLISREFMKKDLSFLISISIMFSLALNSFLYNSNLPYTYAIAYALSGFLLSVLFVIKYIKTENNKYAYLSSLFCGISLANKYEFTFMPFILFYVFIFLKPLGIKNIIKSLCCLLSVPIISFGVLIIQGLNYNDLKETFILFHNLINAPSLKIFFEKFGVFFNAKELINLTLSSKNFALFGFLPIINTFLLLVFFKKIFKTKENFILILIAISACAKTFFFLNVNFMGAFMFPVILISSVLFADIFIKNKFIIKTVLIIFIIMFFSNSAALIPHKQYFLETKKGNIYTFKTDGIPIKKVSDFILQNTKQSDEIAILPEGCIINFLTDRKNNNFYYNLSPLFYNDVFGEERIIKDFSLNPPQYIVILPLNNIEYGISYFGQDYAQNFYNIVIQKYYDLAYDNQADKRHRIRIFKRKNLE